MLLLYCTGSFRGRTSAYRDSSPQRNQNRQWRSSRETLLCCEFWSSPTRNAKHGVDSPLKEKNTAPLIRSQTRRGTLVAASINQETRTGIGRIWSPHEKPAIALTNAPSRSSMRSSSVRSDEEHVCSDDIRPSRCRTSVREVCAPTRPRTSRRRRTPATSALRSCTRPGTHEPSSHLSDIADFLGTYTESPNTMPKGPGRDPKSRFVGRRGSQPTLTARRSALPTRTHPYEPLCYFPPPKTASNNTSQSSHVFAEPLARQQRSQDIKSWIEFDFTFARDHFAKTLAADKGMALASLTVEERVKRWNEWAREGSEGGRGDEKKKATSEELGMVKGGSVSKSRNRRSHSQTAGYQASSSTLRYAEQ